MFFLACVPPVDFSPSGQAAAASSDAQEPRDAVAVSDAQAVARAWQEVRADLKRGAYQEAIAALDRILAQTPDDARAHLYRSLCEQRLTVPAAFPQLSDAQQAALETRLLDEERAQRRSTSQQRALERHIRQEQVRWDAELRTLDREGSRAQQLETRRAKQDAAGQARAAREARRQARLEARTHARAEREQKRDARAKESQARREAVQRARVAPTTPRVETPGATLPAPARKAEPAPASVPPTEAPPTPSMLAAPAAGGPPVELAPVRVTETLVPESLKPPKPPPGAVQINARQMSVSPDRKIATADGDVEMVFENAFLTCDHVTLFTDTKDVYAEGRVRLEEGTQVFRGEMVHYNFDTKKGRFLQGSVASPPWYEYGRSVEHIAEGVYQVTPGYITSCELEPPHFKLYGRRAIVFADEKLARARNVGLIVERLPLLYLPWLSVSDRKSPFFIIPGKKKPWEQFALMGYRYELPNGQRGTLRLDWRRAFLWGQGLDHEFNSKELGKGLLKLYYNEEQNIRVVNPKATLPKGAAQKRYRLLWRHRWEPMKDTMVITDIQKFSDIDFRKDFLFREEYAQDETPISFISLVKSTKGFSLTALLSKRVNRFQTVTTSQPQVTFDTRQQSIGDTHWYSQSKLDVANFQTKRAHSDNDTDVLRLDWYQKFLYAVSWLRPFAVTPYAAVRQTYYTKDIQGSTREGKRNLMSGQFSFGGDASLKLFRIFPVVTNALGLNLNLLRHVLTPTISYSYVHRPTAPNDLLSFPAAESDTNSVTFSLENKLQTKRQITNSKKPRSVDLARTTLSVPYNFRGSGNRQGGRIGEFSFDVELYPWPWMRLESDWKVPSHFPKKSRDARIQAWNVDLILIGGKGPLAAQDAPNIQAPQQRIFQPGPQGGIEMFLPRGQWYLGIGHRYSQNDKTETVFQYDWRISDKWEVSTFHRFTWKEVAGGSKRFNNLREWQYSLRRDLHDWVAETVYQVDREYGEELYFTLTLKAFPEMPIQLNDAYHQPKYGSQSSPFSPLANQRAP